MIPQRCASPSIQEFDSWEESFTAFQARFAHLFARREPRQQAAKYLRGLLAPVERKNGWQLAEAVGDATPDRSQRLLYQAEWEADAGRDILQQFVTETFGDADGIGVVDETAFLKKGRASVGVQRQYSGTAGKIENCQVATLLSYATPRGHVLLDRRLYLPQEWCADAARRSRAKVPPSVKFQTKPQQALAMLQHAWAQGVPMRWVTGDEVYGDAPQLRAAVAQSKRYYVLAVACTTPVWLQRPPLQAPRRDTGGRPRTKARLAPEAPPARSVATVVAQWPAAQWVRLSVAQGEKGPRLYDWARSRVIESRARLPGPQLWLLARRSVDKPSEIAYYLSCAPANTPLQKLAQIAATRFTVEQCIEEAKGEVGLDQYEVRTWPSWHRFLTLGMMALAWLASLRLSAMEQEATKKGVRRAT